MRDDSHETVSGWRAMCSLLIWMTLIPPAIGAAPQTIVNGPVGSGSYGDKVTILPNGNIVVVDPNWNTVGAVYLLRQDGSVISTLTGGTPFDLVGSNGITVLPSGNFLVSSGAWQNAGQFSSGAVTFVDGKTGLNGVVSAANSLVGASANDSVGNVTVLANGNYVVASPSARIDGIDNAGAVTWASGTVGVRGVVSAANSLVGTSANDRVGSGNGLGLFALANGHYVVLARDWDNTASGTANVGAAVWCNGNSGCVGAVTPANALTGSQPDDQVGYSVVALPNGHYVVSSPAWANGANADAGAVTWCNGSSACTGVVGPGNSLVGSSASDAVGGVVFELENGHYIVMSTGWNDGAVADVGAVTWGNAASGITGPVGASNSIVGSSDSDRVGEIFRTLSNGSYLVASRFWDNGATIDAGAVRWGNGNGGSVGAISSANALVGTSVDDFSQPSFIEVGTGNYLVLTPGWNNGSAIDAGAATWGDGTTGSSGPIGAGVSFVGVRSNDNVGFGAVRLANGNYVVRSPNLDSATLADIGAATWGNGTSGSSGIVSAANSLVGVRVGDAVGSSITALANGHYLVSSTSWDSASATNVGAVTWGDGTIGTIGQVTAANSLTGTKNSDGVGSTARALPNGRALTGATSWDNAAQLNVGAYTVLDGNGPIAGFAVSAANSFIGSAADNNVGAPPQIVTAESRMITITQNWDTGVAPLNVGAVCFLDGNLPLIGAVNASDCVLGAVAGAGTTMRVAYEPLHQQTVVGIPAENKIVIVGNRLLSDGFE